MKNKITLLVLLFFGVFALLSSEALAQNNCPTPTSLVTSGQADNSFVLSWSTNSTSNAIYTIRYQIAGTSNWTSITSTHSPYTLSGLNCSTNYIWQVQQVCQGTSNPNYVSEWSVTANFTTNPCQTICPTPISLTSTNVSATSAVLSWSSSIINNTNTFRIRYRSSTASTWTTLGSQGGPYQLGNLSCGTTYVWQVQTLCNNQTGSNGTIPESTWSESHTFTTSSCPLNCPPLTATTASNISQNSAVLTWSFSNPATAGLYTIRYQTPNSPNWVTINNITSPYYSLANLNCSTTYTWQVQQQCYNGSTPGIVSEWSQPSTFSTLACTPTCAAPTALSTGNVTSTGAVLYWNNSNSNPNAFNIRYKTTATTNWTTINYVGPQYQLGNLTCGTTYIWQVQQVCSTASPMVLSPWSNENTFTTGNCPSPCLAPTNLQTVGITASSAYLLWSANSSTTTLFNIRYQSANSTTWTTVNNVTVQHQLSNLNCATTYIWQVQQVCYTTPGTVTTSEWSNSMTFTTSACSPPPCVAPTALETGNVTATSAVLYWNNASSNSNVYNIRFKTTNASNWTTVNFIGSQYPLGNLTCGTTYIWQVQQICSTASPQVLSPWSNENTFTTGTCPSPCLAPTNLQTVGITASSAYLLWSANTSATTLFNIRYQSANSSTWTTVNNVTVQHQLINLNCATAYVWQVQQVCYSTPGTITISEWSNSMTFTTSACPVVCPSPSGLETLSVTANSAVLTWNNSITTNAIFNLRYRKDGSTNWSTVNQVYAHYTLSGLLCNTTYVWQIQQVCYNGSNTITLSEWSNSANFMTAACPPPCAAPSNLETTNISATGAVLVWNATGTASNNYNYNFRYKAVNSTQWTTVNNVSSHYQLGNLSCATGYVWQVQQICDISTTPMAVSPWSAEVTFTTSNCPTICPAPSGLNSLSITGTSAALVWNHTIPATNTYNIRYRSTTNVNWSTVMNVPVQYPLSGLSCSNTYIWQVQQICSNSTGVTNVSPWSAEATFSTLNCPTPCPAPTVLSTTSITATSAVLVWNTVTTAAASYNLRYKTTNNLGWVYVPNVTSPYNLGNLQCGTTYIWQVQQICPNSQLAVENPWSAESSFSTLSCPTPCIAPTALETTNISATGAVLVWNSPTTASSSFNLRYKANNSSSWVYVFATSSPLTLSNLHCGVTYVWQVQQLCSIIGGTVAVSPWSAEVSFTTNSCPISCPAPIGLTASNISTNSAVLSWITTSNIPYSYHIRFRKSNSNLWQTITNATLPFTLGNLHCASTYVWQVQQICSSPSGTGIAVLSPWSESNSFTTSNCADSCGIPTNLTSTYVQPLGVFLGWNAVSGATHYVIRYKRVTTTNSDTPYVTVTSNTNVKQITGLTPGTLYVWQVKAMCANGSTTGNVSGWSVVSHFSTPSSLTSFPNPASNILNASFWMNQNTSITIQLRDSYGKLVYNAQQFALSGSNEISIDVSSFSNGLYFLSFTEGSKTDTSKIMIRH